MTTTRRRLLIGLLALGAAALAWFSPEPEGVVQAVGRSGGVTSDDPSPADPSRLAQGLPPLRQWPSLRDRSPLPVDEAVSTPRDAQEAASTAVTAAAAATPSTPVMPQLPFRYLGSLAVDGQTSVFLASGNDTITARPGAGLPGNWRFEAFAGDRLEFTFLPTASRQSLNIAAP